MKLLTTIAAVLISISAFSQDLIEYDNGTFTHNGEELSMQQIDDLTLLHKAGRGNVRKASRFILLSENKRLRVGNNAANFLGGLGAAVAAVPVSVIGYLFANVGVLWPGGAIGYTGGAGLAVVSYKAFSRIASKDMCLPKRDKHFNKVADKINQAIAAGGPLVQSSNQ